MSFPVPDVTGTGPSLSGARWLWLNCLYCCRTPVRGGHEQRTRDSAEPPQLGGLDAELEPAPGLGPPVEVGEHSADGPVGDGEPPGYGFVG